MGLFNILKKTPLTLESRDIHSHILPGVDDGFSNVDDSIEAIKRLSDKGVRELVLTPHINPEIFLNNSEPFIRDQYERFISQIPSNIEMSISLAAEYMIVPGFEKRSKDPSLLLFEDNESILVEMSYFYRSPNLEEAIFNLLMDGKKPILAHPERYTYMADCLEDFDKLAESGCRFQMNCLSLSGCYGPESMKILSYLKRQNLYSFKATDLHSLRQLEAIIKIKTSK